MNFTAYNELRILGYSPEEAVKLAESHTPIGMYEIKNERENGSHKGSAPVIGLKAEFKQLIQSQQSNNQGV